MARMNEWKYTVHGKLELNNEKYAINYLRQLLRIEGKERGWVKVRIGEKVRFKWPDVLKKPWLFV